MEPRGQSDSGARPQGTPSSFPSTCVRVLRTQSRSSDRSQGAVPWVANGHAVREIPVSISSADAAWFPVRSVQALQTDFLFVQRRYMTFQDFELLIHLFSQ